MAKKPPAGLSARSEGLWRAALRAGSRSSGRLALLEQALRALDAADGFRDLLATQELLTATKGTGTLHVNPLWRAQTEAIETFTRLARLLGLQWDPEVDGHEVASVYEAPDYGREASHLAPRRPGPGNGHEADEARTSHDAPTGGDNTHEDPAAASDRAPVNLTSLCRRCHDNETGREGQAAR